MGGSCLHVTFQVWIQLDSYSGYEWMHMCVGIWGFYNRRADTVYTSTHDNKPELNDMSDSKPHFLRTAKQKIHLLKTICSFSIALYRKYTYTHTHVHV